MKSLRPLFLFMIVLVTFTSIVTQADDLRLSCDGEVQSPIRQMMRITKLAIETHELELTDVEYMIADPATVQDPYARKSRSVGNITLRIKLRRALRAIKPDSIPDAHVALQKLISTGTKLSLSISEAAHRTESVFAPKPLTSEAPAALSLGEYHPTWFKSKTGELFLVNFTHHDAHLQVYRLGQPQAIADRFLKLNFVPKDEVGGSHAFTNSKGHLIVAVFYPSWENILLYNVDLNQIVEQPAESGIYGVHAVERGGQTYLMTWTGTGVSVYSVEVDLHLTKIHAHKIKSDNYLFSSNSKGDVLFVTRRGMRQITVLDPFKPASLRHRKSKYEIYQMRSVITEAGDYAIALSTVPKIYLKPRITLEFITSQSDGAMFSQKLNTMTQLGEWTITRDGRALLPLAHSTEDRTGWVSIFEPLKPVSLPSQNWIKRNLGMGHTLAPSYAISLRHEVPSSPPSLLEARDGRLLVANVTATNNDIAHVQIYDLQNSQSPLYRFQTTPFYAVDLHLSESEFKDRFLIQTYDFERQFRLFDETGTVIDRPNARHSEIVNDRYGQSYFFLLQNFAQRRWGKATFFRIMSRPGEAR